jgi:hypothetical protein
MIVIRASTMHDQVPVTDLLVNFFTRYCKALMTSIFKSK